MQQFKEDQWYQLPSGLWAKAVCVDDPLGPILMVYGVDIGDTKGYTVQFDLDINRDGTLSATGLCTWDTWRPEDLREATPDEAETQTLRTLRIGSSDLPVH